MGVPPSKGMMEVVLKGRAKRARIEVRPDSEKRGIEEVSVVVVVIVGVVAKRDRSRKRRVEMKSLVGFKTAVVDFVM